MEAPALFDCIVQDHELQLEIDKYGHTNFGCYNNRVKSKVEEGRAICAAVFRGMTSDSLSCTMRLDSLGHASWSGPRLQATASPELASFHAAREKLRRSTCEVSHLHVRDGRRSQGLHVPQIEGNTLSLRVRASNYRRGRRATVGWSPGLDPRI